VLNRFPSLHHVGQGFLVAQLVSRIPFHFYEVKPAESLLGPDAGHRSPCRRL